MVLVRVTESQGLRAIEGMKGSHPVFVGDWTNEGWWVLKADDLQSWEVLRKNGLKEQEGKRKTPAPPSSRRDVAEKNKHHWRRLRELFSERTCVQ